MASSDYPIPSILMSSISSSSIELPGLMSLSQSQLRGSAKEFVPSAMLLNNAGQNPRRLNPEAAVFKPTWVPNVFAPIFIPATPPIPDRHPDRAPRVLIVASQESRGINTPTEQLVPQCTDIKVNNTDFSNTSTLRPAVDEHNDNETVSRTPEVLPRSITQSRVETGSLQRRSNHVHQKTLPSSFPIEDGSTPSFLAASNIVYNGRAENQKQKFKLGQCMEREIFSNWKGKLLCVNGEELPGSSKDLSAEQEEAEIAALPPAVHHFNWLGNPVRFKSTTPPAVSLVVIMSLLKPRGLTYGCYKKNLQMSTVLRNALDTVDPVWYFGSEPELLHEYKGTRLQEVVIGDVVKIYSEHGYWHEIDSESYGEEEDVPEYDPLDEAVYDPAEVILNGWYENYDVPTLRDFIQLDSNASEMNELMQKLAIIRRRSCDIKKSLLNPNRDPSRDQSGYTVSSSNPTESPLRDQPSSNNITSEHEVSEILEDWADEAENLPELPLIDGDWQQRVLAMQEGFETIKESIHDHSVLSAASESTCVSEDYQSTSGDPQSSKVTSESDLSCVHEVNEDVVNPDQQEQTAMHQTAANETLYNESATTDQLLENLQLLTEVGSQYNAAEVDESTETLKDSPLSQKMETRSELSRSDFVEDVIDDQSPQQSVQIKKRTDHNTLDVFQDSDASFSPSSAPLTSAENFELPPRPSIIPSGRISSAPEFTVFRDSEASLEQSQRSPRLLRSPAVRNLRAPLGEIGIQQESSRSYSYPGSDKNARVKQRGLLPVIPESDEERNLENDENNLETRRRPSKIRQEMLNEWASSVRLDIPRRRRTSIVKPPTVSTIVETDEATDSFEQRTPSIIGLCDESIQSPQSSRHVSDSTTVAGADSTVTSQITLVQPFRSVLDDNLLYPNEIQAHIPVTGTASNLNSDDHGDGFEKLTPGPQLPHFGSVTRRSVFSRGHLGDRFSNVFQKIKSQSKDDRNSNIFYKMKKGVSKVFGKEINVLH